MLTVGTDDLLFSVMKELTFSYLESPAGPWRRVSKSESGPKVSCLITNWKDFLFPLCTFVKNQTLLLQMCALNSCAWQVCHTRVYPPLAAIAGPLPPTCDVTCQCTKQTLYTLLCWRLHCLFSFSSLVQNPPDTPAPEIFTYLSSFRKVYEFLLLLFLFLANCQRLTPFQIKSANLI